ncbi:lactosylceramide 4-alpha-galactosyltransferase-like isoform X2 [Nomia melanderi]|uniref:lactosylceramide 4-alpha-galactosyltransferase-like isoform X2 n=1 Tax=Nomia melanderi TaxID=2448451 RepID=UPI001304244A|nr:lactosylceramide 4-alpha-galactosyltransferase-like isoform X2 [Nomia melanderi]
MLVGPLRLSATRSSLERISTKMKKRLLLCFVCAVLLFLIMISTDNDCDINCYEMASTSNSLPGFDPNSKLDVPIEDKNIFFHETSCFDDGLVLNARQACAVESAAKMNPSMNVYLFFTSPSKISNHSEQIFNQLQTYPNIKIRRIYPEEYVMGTPLEQWYKSGVLKRSQWPRNHMSDILRYLTLWKFGGIYLDLDVVVITSLEHLSNFAGAEDWNHIAAGVMGFDLTPMGRRVADACIRDLKANYRGNIWGNNGPGVITRTLQKICSTEHIRDMSTVRCQGFRVFSPSAFYPIHYEKWKMYFEMKDKNVTMKRLEKAMIIHVWNKLSGSEPVRVNSDVPYAVIARKHCPLVFKNCGDTF